MPRITVNRVDQDLAIRVPQDAARIAGISAGDSVEVRASGRAIVIERVTEHDRADAQRAAEEMIADSDAIR